MTDEEDSVSWLRRELVGIVREKIGFHENFAEPMADALLAGLCERIGGREVYIPSPSKPDRDAQIRAKFNGRNLPEVMREFGVSRRTVYRACK